MLCLCAAAAPVLLINPQAASGAHVRALRAGSVTEPAPTSAPLARPVLTPAAVVGGLPVVYAGAGDGSWPDQMEPNDSEADALGAAPVEVGVLYRSLNLVPRSDPANLVTGEDRDWYVWGASAGRCYRAFTGDAAFSARQRSGQGRLQHGIRLWWSPPVSEGHSLLAEYEPSAGTSAPGGYFASAYACAGVDGRIAAEVYNYGAPLKYPLGATYTFGVLDAGPIPPPASPTPPYATAAVPYASSAPAGSQSSVGPTYKEQAIGSQDGEDGSGAPPSSSGTPSEPIAAYTAPPGPAAAGLVTPTAFSPARSAQPGGERPSGEDASPTPQPTQVPPASVDVVAYLDRNRNGAPDPGEGLRSLRVVLLSVRTNAVQQSSSTNANGHARIEWSWTGKVRVSLPDLNWSDLVDPYDMLRSTERADIWSISDGGLYLEVRVLPSALPAVIP